MGLQKKLLNDGSVFSKFNGQTVPTLQGSTNRSELHASADGIPGYSLTGFQKSLVNRQYQNYDDGVPNLLPQPSELDLQGIKPKGPLKSPKFRGINNTFQKGTYKNNLPQGAASV